MPPIRSRVPFDAPVLRAVIVATAITAIAAVGTAFGVTTVDAHSGIAASDPTSGSTIDDPIDSVTIDFGADIGSTAQLALIGPDGSQIPSSTTVTSTTTAVAEFDRIDDEGTYTVNYIATSVVDGHVLSGFITFIYGDTSADRMSPVLFGAIALVILGIGGWFSWRARQRAHARDADTAA